MSQAGQGEGYLSGSIEESELDVAPQDSEAVFNKALSLAGDNPYITLADYTKFIDKYAIGLRKIGESGVLSVKTYSSFGLANEYAGSLKKGYEKVWLGGVNRGNTNYIYKIATFSGRQRFIGGLGRPVWDISGVENATKVLAHEGVHFAFPKAGHGIKFSYAEYDSVKYYRNK